MGSCCNMKFEQKVIKLPVRPLSIYFFHSLRKSVYKIAEDGLKKVKMPKINANKGCAIGHLLDGTIMLAGGIKTNGRLSKKVLSLHPPSSSVTKHSKLSKPVFQGQIFLLSTGLYYISNDLNQPHQKFTNNKWHLIRPNPINLTSSSILLQENIFYFLCGHKLNNKPTKKLFFLNTEKPENYQLMKHKLNFKLSCPVSYSAYDFVVVAGGKKVNECYNSNFYVQKNWEWKELLGPNIVLENYPVLFSNRVCVFIGKDEKVVTLDSELKFKVYQKRAKGLNRALTERPKQSRSKIQRHMVDSRYIQDMLNNYVFIQNKSFNSQKAFEDASESELGEADDDKSEKRVINPSYEPTNINSLTRNENSPSAFNSFQLHIPK